MTEGANDNPAPGRTHRYVPLAVWAVVFLILLIIPLKIIGYGYLPSDDALVDAAKAVTGKPWQDILVLKSDFKIDNHIGWHAALRGIELLTKAGDETLVIISVVMLFALMGWSGLPWLSRPEAWLAALVLVIGVETPMVGRLMLGRPFMLSYAMLLTILFFVQKRGPSPPGIAGCVWMTGCMAIAIALHGVWYFWALLIVAFLLARQFQWAIAATVAWIAGTILGGILTGHPVVYLGEAWLQAVGVIGRHSMQSTLATELQPGGSNFFPLLLIGGTLILRQLAKLPCRPLASDPVFWLAAMGWVLGHQAERLWDDWGVPPLLVLVAGDLDLFLRTRLPLESVKRVTVIIGLAVTAFFVMTTDVGSRWSAKLTSQYLVENDPNLADWLPGPGGIFYKADMEFFYKTFFKNPTAPWRYMVGYEPVLMPQKDFDTYQSILINQDDTRAYKPWIEEMRPEDRLVVDAIHDPGALMPDLEWKHTFSQMWIGKLKEKKTEPKAARASIQSK